MRGLAWQTTKKNRITKYNPLTLALSPTRKRGQSQTCNLSLISPELRTHRTGTEKFYFGATTARQAVPAIQLVGSRTQLDQLNRLRLVRFDIVAVAVGFAFFGADYFFGLAGQTMDFFR